MLSPTQPPNMRRRNISKVVCNKVRVVACEEARYQELRARHCPTTICGVRLSVIDKVNKDSTKEEDGNEGNETNNETANDNKEASIGGSGFSVPSSNNNCKKRSWFWDRRSFAD